MMRPRSWQIIGRKRDDHIAATGSHLLHLRQHDLTVGDAHIARIVAEVEKLKPTIHISCEPPLWTLIGRVNRADSQAGS